MNGLERVMATVRGEPRDRPAASALLSLYGAALTGCPLQQYYTDPHRYVEGQQAVVDAFCPDILFTPFVLPAEGEAFGSEVKYLPKSPPNLLRPAAPTTEELLALDPPDLDNHPRIGYLRESTRLLAQRFKTQFVIAGVALGPLEIPAMIMGLEGWLETVLFQPSRAEKILERMVAHFVHRAEAFFSDGAHLIALPVVFCNPAVITRHIVERVAIPAMSRAFARCPGPIVIHHGGGPMNEFLPALTSLPNVIGFVTDQRDPLNVSRGILDKGQTLLGNVDGPTLNHGSAEQIARHCLRILENRREDPRFILQTAGPDVPFDTPREHIAAILNAAREFGSQGAC